MSREIMCTRRDFLKRAALSGGALTGLAALAACAPQQPTPSEGQPTSPPSTGAEPTAAPKAKVALRHMYWGTEQEKAVTQQMNTFNEQSENATVETNLVPWAQYWDKLWTALAGGGAPDSFWLNMSNFASLSAKGALLSIQPYLDKDDSLKEAWEINFDSLKAAYTYNNEAHSWPRDYDTIAVAMNLKLLEEAGLEYPSDADDFKGWDWAACRSYAEQLTKQEGGRTTQFGLLASNTSQSGWFNWIYSNGGTILNADKTHCTLGEPAALEALRDYVSYRLDGLAPGQETLQSQESNDLFYTGRVAMSILGDWNIGSFNERITDFDYDIVPIPYAPTGKSICMIHGLGDTIDKNAKNPDAAFEWVSFLGSEEGSSILGNTGTVIPSRADTAELWFDPSFKPDHRRIYLDWTARSAFFPNTAEPASSEWTKVITDELTLVMEQGKDLDEAVEAIVQGVDAILAGQGK